MVIFECCSLTEADPTMTAGHRAVQDGGITQARGWRMFPRTHQFPKVSKTPALLKHYSKSVDVSSANLQHGLRRTTPTPGDSTHRACQKLFATCSLRPIFRKPRALEQFPCFSSRFESGCKSRFLAGSGRFTREKALRARQALSSGFALFT